MVEKSIKFRFIDLYVGSSSELEKAQMECIQSLHDSSAKLEQRERIIQLDSAEAYIFHSWSATGTSGL